MPKPAGGYVLISVVQLAAAWTAYREGVIRLADLRCWFACWEIAARRCQLEKNRRARFATEELGRLVGEVQNEHTRSSLRRLERAGLLTWTADALQFAVNSPATLELPTSTMLGLIANNRRKVPVPRRMLRFLAAEAGRVMIATVIGHLLRCLYYRSGRCEPVGTCKASWIADAFRVDSRNVKTARRELVLLSWLEVGGAPQWRLNRFGAVVRINLSWATKCAQAECLATASILPPPQSRLATGSPPPESNQELTSEYKNQKPAPSRPDGFCRSRGKAKKMLMRPRLERIVPEDLQSMARLTNLFEQAKGRGLVRDGEASWLAFAAAAEHARSIGKANPCGLFSAIIRRQLWRFVSQQAEDSARRRARCEFATCARGRHQPMYQSHPPARAQLRAARITDIVQQVFTSIRCEHGRSGSWNHDAMSNTLAKVAAKSADSRSGPENISTPRDRRPTPSSKFHSSKQGTTAAEMSGRQNGLRSPRVKDDAPMLVR